MYRQKNFVVAKQHYERAKSIIDLVRGEDAGSQAEINVNRMAINLNMAALYLVTREPRKAVKSCTDVLEEERENPKALLRRAKAYLKMHEYQVNLMLQATLKSPISHYISKRYRSSAKITALISSTWFKDMTSRSDKVRCRYVPTKSPKLQASTNCQSMQAVAADLASLKKIGAWDCACEEVGLALLMARKAEKNIDSSLYRKMLL